MSKLFAFLNPTPVHEEKEVFISDRFKEHYQAKGYGLYKIKNELYRRRVPKAYCSRDWSGSDTPWYGEPF